MVEVVRQSCAAHRDFVVVAPLAEVGLGQQRCEDYPQAALHRECFRPVDRRPVSDRELQKKCLETTATSEDLGGRREPWRLHPRRCRDPPLGSFSPEVGRCSL